MNEENTMDFSEELKKLREKFTEDLREKLREANADWVKIQTAGFDGTTLRNLQKQFHTIAGSAGTFGFRRIGQIAQNIDTLLVKIAEKKSPPSQPEVAQINVSMDTLLRIPLEPDNDITKIK